MRASDRSQAMLARDGVGGELYSAKFRSRPQATTTRGMDYDDSVSCSRGVEM